MTAPTAVYRVTLNTPIGVAVLDIPSADGPDAAGERARCTAVAAWGGAGQVTVTDTRHVGELR